MAAIPGIGALQESLAETNRLLAAVLAELQKTNDQELAHILAGVQDLARHLGAPPRE